MEFVTLYNYLHTQVEQSYLIILRGDDLLQRMEKYPYIPFFSSKCRKKYSIHFSHVSGMSRFQKGPRAQQRGVYCLGGRCPLEGAVSTRGRNIHNRAHYPLEGTCYIAVDRRLSPPLFRGKLSVL